MAVVTQSTGAQSSADINGQSVSYIAQQVSQIMPGAPDPLVNNILQQTIREFYYKSAGWQEDIGPFNITAPQTEYDLNPIGQYARVHLIMWAWMYPSPTGALSPVPLRPSPVKRYAADVGPPFSYSTPRPDRMIIYPIPDKNYGQIMYVHATLMPVINASRLPKIAIDYHFDGLLYGTLWRLGMMPSKPWTIKDSQLLNEWRRINRQQILMARDLAERGYGPSDSRMRMPNFAGSYSQSPNMAGGSAF